MNNCTLCSLVQNSLPWKVAKKNIAKDCSPHSPMEWEKKEKFLVHPERGKSSDKVNRSIIQAFTLLYTQIPGCLLSRFKTLPPCMRHSIPNSNPAMAIRESSVRDYEGPSHSDCLNNCCNQPLYAPLANCSPYPMSSQYPRHPWHYNINPLSLRESHSAFQTRHREQSEKCFQSRSEMPWQYVNASHFPPTV